MTNQAMNNTGWHSQTSNKKKILCLTRYKQHYKRLFILHGEILVSMFTAGRGEAMKSISSKENKEQVCVCVCVASSAPINMALC